MIHPATSDRLTVEEKHQVHNSRVIEFEAGQISGKEFIFSLVSQCGFSEMEAKKQWQEIRDLGNVAIYKKVCGDTVFYFKDGGFSGVSEWREGRIASFYASQVGAVVEVAPGLKIPFSLFELRAVK